jgi:hypothetical protein
MHWALTNAATRLDTLVAAGAREEIEREASPYTTPGSYTEPFALRALGIARDDETLLARAAEAFRALELDRYAAQTDRLGQLRKLALG